MGEYKRLGYWSFWEHHGEAVKTVDANLVEPVLRELGATVTEKWHADSNCIFFRIKGQQFAAVFDVPMPQAALELEVRKFSYDGYKWNDGGKIAIRLPRTKWSSLRKALKLRIECLQ